MPDQLRTGELPAKQLSQRAAGFAVLAKGAEMPYLREVFDRLAGQYARLAAEREREESQPA